MCKRLFVLVLLLAAAPSVFGAVGIFNNNVDVRTAPNNPLGIGYVLQVGDNDYLIGAGGDDIWGEADQFHYAYNEVTGNIRVSLHPEWQDKVDAIGRLPLPAKFTAVPEPGVLETEPKGKEIQVPEELGMVGPWGLEPQTSTVSR